MNLVDANVLIYAVNSNTRHHERCRRWLESALSGTDMVGFAWTVLLAFLRISTRRGIFESPLEPEAALAYVDSWLEQPSAVLVQTGPNHWPILRALITASGTSGNLTSDAHLAALALEGGWTVVSTDNDFRRFSGLNVVNPILE